MILVVRSVVTKFGQKLSLKATVNAWRMAKLVTNPHTNHTDCEQTRTKVHITEANGTRSMPFLARLAASWRRAATMGELLSVQRNSEPALCAPHWLRASKGAMPRWWRAAMRHNQPSRAAHEHIAGGGRWREAFGKEPSPAAA